MKLTQKIVESKGIELSRESKAPTSTSSATTELFINFVSADQIHLSYNTMPGNQPQDCGNYVALWQNYYAIPWEIAPLKTQSINMNTPMGDMVFGDLEVTNKSYIVGYAAGPELTNGNRQAHGNMCATALIPAKGCKETQKDFTPNLTMYYIGTDSVPMGYRLPPGEKPQTNGAWIGIWRAAQASHNDPPLASNNIQLDKASGSTFINDINIGRGLTYTVGLFTSGWVGSSESNNQKPMACSVTFTND